jgi:DNA-binding GntR family transcriptional regulator
LREGGIVSSPKHALLAETLRERVDQGLYEDGRIPSEAALAEEFKVSRTTVRAALIALQNEGLLWAQSGVGYFVRRFQHFVYRPQDDFRRTKQMADVEWLTGADDPDPFVKAAAGREVDTRFEVTMVPATGDVTRRLGVPEGEFVVLRKRLRLLGGVGYQLYDSYYPRNVVEGTEVMEPREIPRGVYQVLAERGYAQVRALDEIWVRMPRPSEVDRLKILPGTPVAEHIITGFTAEGRPVLMARVVLPGDRNVIAFERTHPDLEPERAG